MDIVIAGHVDHGKSTLIGRLLADTKTLPEGRLDQVRAYCAQHGKPFEYSFLLDALADEQAQGITIDAARVFFNSAKRPYLILDAPGHIDFLKNMITGASRAEAAILVVDAEEGIRENSRRHGFVLGMLGINQVAVVVNKMDKVGHDRSRFEEVVKELGAFLAELDVHPTVYVPVSARDGVNVVARGEDLDWYEGPTLLETLDGFEEAPAANELPLRLPIQGVYKFAQAGDDRRILAGTVETGRIVPGDEVVLYPSGRQTRVNQIEAFAREALPAEAVSGEAIGITLCDQIYAKRGEILGRLGEPGPDVGALLRVSVIWLGARPLRVHDEVLFRLGTAKVPARVQSIDRVLNGATLGDGEDPEAVGRHDVGEIVLKTRRPVAVDPSDRLGPTSRFVLVRDHDTVGGGLVREVLPDADQDMRELVFQRNSRWEAGRVGRRQRAAQMNQEARLVLVTGASGDQRRKEVAKAVEVLLFERGRHVYYIGLGSVVHGLDADVPSDRSLSAQREHFRRLGEVAHLMLDAGVLLIVTADAVQAAEMRVLKTALGGDRIDLVWVGATVPEGVGAALRVDGGDVPQLAGEVVSLLEDRGAWFVPR